MIKRKIVEYLTECVSNDRITVLDGARQSGKTSLVRETFPDYNYVSLRDLQMFDYAQNELESFLQWAGNKCIIDDLEAAPHILGPTTRIINQIYPSGSSHIFITTYHGIYNELPVNCVTLLPLSWFELSMSTYNVSSLNEFLLRGGYPRVYAEGMQNSTSFSTELAQHYINREPYYERNSDGPIKYINLFRTLAFRLGEPLNLQSVADSCEISIATASRWVEQLELTNMIYLLPAWKDTFSKRVIKSPRIYLCDTGIACALQYITSQDQVQFHPKRNALFINMMLNERLKYLYNRGLKSDMYYYETTHGLGVPVLYEHQDHLHTAMITSSPIAKETDANKLLRFLELSGIAPEHCAILYNGKKTVEINSIEFRPWRSHIVTRIERNSFAI